MSRRTRADRCPGVLRPWPAEDGALVRLRIPGGRTTRSQLAALLAVAREHGDGRVHLTSRANLQLRALPSIDGRLPEETVAAIRATGLLPHPDHELVRNVMVSPLTGLLGGRADLRPVVAELDERLCARPSLATLPGRFLFVLDDGRGDLVERSLDLGLVAVDADQAQLRLGGEHWGPVVPLSRAAAELTALARAFVQVRGTGPDAAWHVDELPVTPDGVPRDDRTRVRSDPPEYGPLTDTLHHLAVPDGILTGVDHLGSQESDEIVVTPWRSLVLGR